MKTEFTRPSGFTMIEMMVVVAVLGILAAMALPNFRSMVQSQRIKSAGYEVYAALVLARSEAIKRNSNVTITLAASPVSWTITGANGMIQNHPQLPGITLTSNPSATNITFQRSGRTVGTVPTFLIDAYGATTPYASCIKIELSGMPRTYKPSNGAC